MGYRLALYWSSTLMRAVPSCTIWSGKVSPFGNILRALFRDDLTRRASLRRNLSLSRDSVLRRDFESETRLGVSNACWLGDAIWVSHACWVWDATWVSVATRFCDVTWVWDASSATWLESETRVLRRDLRLSRDTSLRLGWFWDARLSRKRFTYLQDTTYLSCKLERKIARYFSSILSYPVRAFHTFSMIRLFESFLQMCVSFDIQYCIYSTVQINLNTKYITAVFLHCEWIYGIQTILMVQ